MSWIKKIHKHLKSQLNKDPLKKSFRREPLYLDMLGHALAGSPVTMISIGSSDGVESLYALQRKQSDVRIHLLEPDPDNLDICRETIYLL